MSDNRLILILCSIIILVALPLSAGIAWWAGKRGCDFKTIFLISLFCGAPAGIIFALRTTQKE